MSGEILPDAFARFEQIAEDRAAAASLDRRSSIKMWHAASVRPSDLEGAKAQWCVLRNPVGPPAVLRRSCPSTTGCSQHKHLPSSRRDRAHTSWLRSTAP